MTTKISLFNKGVYKSTVKRYLWGSILYFALLFIMTGLNLFLNLERYEEYGYSSDKSLLLSSYLLFPMLIAMVVPTITGLLVFRFVHSKKVSVFMHSFPVNRTANYISSVCAGLTLMLVPIIFNTLVLVLISAVTGGEYFSIADSGIWMLYNIFGIFIMFSCTCFVSFLTGNGVTMVVLNVLFHVLPVVITAGVNRIAEVFLCGFPGGGQLTESLSEFCFPLKAIAISSSLMYEETEKTGNILVIIVLAVLMYILGTVLYVKRRMETVGDIAGFRCLNPVFKYITTFMGAVVTFSILGDTAKRNIIVSSVLAIIVCSIIYFGIEMLLRKSFAVMSSVKGYAAMVLVCGVLLYLVSGTSFFGYETYTPDPDEISSVYIGEDYGDDKFATGENAVNGTVKLHKELIAKGEFDDWGPKICIKYRLKNGKTVERAYTVEYELYEKIIEEKYQIDEFKKITEPIFSEVKSYIKADIFNIDEPIEITDAKKVDALVECLRKDIESMDYTVMKAFGWGFSVQVEYASQNNKTEENGEFFRYDVNSNFKETVNWIKENGYWDRVKIKHNGPVLIQQCDNSPYRDLKGMEVTVDINKGIRVEGEECEKLYEYIYSAKQEKLPDEETYLVYAITNEQESLCELIALLPKAKVEELIK